LLLSSGTLERVAQQSPDDFSVGMMFFLVVGVVFSLICIGVGIVLTVLVILFLVGLVSSSVVAGMYQKSFLKGIKAFVRLSVMVGGVLTGSSGLWMLNKFTHWWTPKSALVSGAGIGLLSGYLLSILIFFVLRRLSIYLKQLRIDGVILSNS
jgi:hypothetical protein